MKHDDEFFMSIALEEAKQAFQQEEVPVGAVLVFDGNIISKGHNLVETLKDATAHAEMQCLKQAANSLKSWRLNGSTLYCTLEPCSMCAGAMLLSRVSTLVWGAPDLRHGADGSWMDLLRTEHPIHRIEVRRGVLKEESAAMMTEFFKIRR